jgi:N utilization substance protein B
MVSSSPPRLPQRERIDRMRARSWILHILYAWESQGEGRSLSQVGEEVVRTRSVSAARRPLIRNGLTRIERRLPEVDAAIVHALDHWKLDRLSRVDRSVLRIAASELLFEEEVPRKVAIQEGIRLAGQYGGHDSARFVNGVLDAIFRTAEQGA